MMKVAILYICIGEYVKFWKDFYCSFEQNFLEEYLKEYFVFTDHVSIFDEESNKRIHRIYQPNLGWPGNTLFRFDMFLKIEEELERFDYIFFMNANAICVQKVTPEMFLPLDNKLLLVQHPGYYSKQNYEFPYERNKKSNAYIPYGKGDVYVCGGINGGKAYYYLNLVKELSKRIQDDYNRGVVAKWHDESHLNKYIFENKDYRLLSPAFCYPEGEEIPFEVFLMVKDKGKMINLPVEKIKSQTKVEIKSKLAGIFLRFVR